MESTARLRVVILLVLIGVALASSLWAVWPWPTGDWKGLALNFGTEMAGAVVTYLLLELVIGRMEKSEVEREVEEKEREAKKADLIAQMGSSVKDVAVAAAEELGRHGWLYDGSLQGAYLLDADLQGANLIGANLQGADLFSAKLQRATLFRANLQVANLFQANLQEARLIGGNLQGAFLDGTNLQGATLFQADLQGASLEFANLREANLQWANLNENTTLPDGTKWTPDTDMARFTDPDHPDFWQPDAEVSW